MVSEPPPPLPASQQQPAWPAKPLMSLVPDQESFQAMDEPNANFLRDIVSPPNAVIESVSAL